MNENDIMMNKDQLLVQSVWPEWKLTDLLGSGQYGVVWKARKQSLAGDSFAAIKVVTIEVENNRNSFTPEQADSYLASVARNYAREIRMMESVKGYSNIVNIEDYSIISNSGGKPWFVLIRMELLIPLYEYLETRKIDGESILRIGTDLCKALEICAAKKIVHRDIKPANVFVNDAGVFKLGDFGVARQILTDTSQTRTGTPDFMAPEIYNNTLHSSDFEDGQRADIYSLGMLLYWIANGKKMPFVSQDGLITAQQISEAFTRRMSGEKFPGPVNASESLKKVILKACSYHPDERYKSAEFFRKALEDLNTQFDKEKTNARGSRKHLLVIVLICIMLLVGITALFLFGTVPPVPSPALETFTPAPTVTSTVSYTPTPDISPTPTPVTTPTSTPTSTPTPVITLTSTPTSTPTPGITPAPTPTFTPEYQPTESPVPSETPSPWPIITTEGSKTRLKGLGQEERHPSYLGPDRRYVSGGWFKPGHVSSALAIFREDDYILVDLDYSTVGRRCVYFAASKVTDIPEITVSPAGVPVTVTETVQPRLGPGEKYDTKKLPVLQNGDTVNALLEWNGWILAEYQDKLGLIRAWIPTEKIR